MERMPPRTEAITMIRVEGVMIRVVLLSLTGLGVGLAARMAGYTDEDKTTSPGPLIGGDVGETVGCDVRKATREVGVGNLSPPWPGDPGVVASVIAWKTSWMGFNLGPSSEGAMSCFGVEESKRPYMVTKSLSALGVNVTGTARVVDAG
jgi:hypothetical protein